MIRLSLPNLTPPQAVRFGGVLKPNELRALAELHDVVATSSTASDEEKKRAAAIAARYRREADAQENG
ncbi:MAG: hypothetical protein AB7P76_13140 [Candidatus Melainabacteria bacterium]